jgi:addiction module HigA family antidote
MVIRIPTNRVPTHPGQVLLNDFLNPMGLTQRAVADAIHVPFQRINDIVNGRRGVSPETALWLAKYFSTSPDFWMNLQLQRDMYVAQNKDKEADILKEIQSLPPYQVDQ